MSKFQLDTNILIKEATNEKLLKIIEELKKNENIKKLTIQGKFGGEILKELVKIIENSKLLTEIYLESEFNSNDCKELSEYLSKNNSLVNVSFIGIQNEIIKFLPENKSIKILKIQGNKLNFKELFTLLLKNLTIHELDISFCELKDEGVMELNEFLKENKKVKKLDISKNKVTMKGIDLIIETLKNNEILKEIDISRNDVKDESAEIIVNKIVDHKQLFFF